LFGTRFAFLFEKYFAKVADKIAQLFVDAFENTFTGELHVQSKVGHFLSCQSRSVALTRRAS
jgi:hypothetical protein